MALLHEIWAPDSETPKSDRYNGKILFLERPEPTAEIFPVKLNIFTEPQRKPHVKICSQQKVIRAVLDSCGVCLVCMWALGGAPWELADSELPNASVAKLVIFGGLIDWMVWLVSVCRRGSASGAVGVIGGWGFDC